MMHGMQERAFGRLAIDAMTANISAGRARDDERWESFTETFGAEVARARTFVDVGAEYGFYVRLAILYGRPGLRIVAFEPEPDRYALLAETLPRRVELRCAAAAIRTSNRVAFKPAPGVSLSLSEAMHGDVSRTLVSAVALDDVFRTGSVDVMKFDVEGADLEAIAGARELLARCRPTLFVECHPATSTNDPVALVALLREVGYVIDGKTADAIACCGRVVLSGKERAS